MKDKEKIIRVKPIRYYEEDKNKFKQQLKELLDAHLIRESNSPHSSQVFIVRKHAEIVIRKS